MRERSDVKAEGAREAIEYCIKIKRVRTLCHWR